MEMPEDVMSERGEKEVKNLQAKNIDESEEKKRRRARGGDAHGRVDITFVHNLAAASAHFLHPVD